MSQLFRQSFMENNSLQNYKNKSSIASIFQVSKYAIENRKNLS